MSETPQTEQVEVDESTDESNVFVVDPDDYQKTKKLKAIHNARDHVLDVRKNKRDSIDHYNQFQGPWYETYHRHLAETVASYGHEVMPIIEEAKEEGVIDDDLLSIEGPVHILEFIYTEGKVEEDGEMTYPSPVKTMAVYRQLDKILRELGLGLSFEEDQGPAEI